MNKKKEELIEEREFNAQRQQNKFQNFNNLENNTVSLLSLLESQNQAKSPSQTNILQQQMENMTIQSQPQGTSSEGNVKSLESNSPSKCENSEADWTLLEKSEEFANFAIYRKMHKAEKVPGVYTRDERLQRILRFKNKIRKWRTAHPVNRNFKGRSAVAGKKPRIKGKFVTPEEYQDYLNSQRPNHKSANESSYVTENSECHDDSALKEEFKN